MGTLNNKPAEFSFTDLLSFEANTEKILNEFHLNNMKTSQMLAAKLLGPDAVIKLEKRIAEWQNHVINPKF